VLMKMAASHNGARRTRKTSAQISATTLNNMLPKVRKASMASPPKEGRRRPNAGMVIHNTKATTAVTATPTWQPLEGGAWKSLPGLYTIFIV